MSFCIAQSDHNRRGTAHARSKLVCCASSPVTASAGAPALGARGAGLALEAVAGTSRHGLARKERGLLLARCSVAGHEQSTTSAAQRERAASSCAKPPPQRQLAPARLLRVTCGAGLALQAEAYVTHHGLARKGRDPLPAQCSSAGMGLFKISLTRRARAQKACVLHHLPRDN